MDGLLSHGAEEGTRQRGLLRHLLPVPVTVTATAVAVAVTPAFVGFGKRGRGACLRLPLHPSIR